MTLVELLELCRGEDTKAAFAERLGISQRMLSATYSGERGAGPFETLYWFSVKWRIGPIC